MLARWHVCRHKHKHIMFFLLQTEFGDIFKLTLQTEDDVVKGLTLKYFDTVPVAAGMCLLKNGLLFVCSEFANHALYQVAQLGDNEDEPTYVITPSLLPPFAPCPLARQRRRRRRRRRLVAASPSRLG